MRDDKSASEEQHIYPINITIILYKEMETYNQSSFFQASPKSISPTTIDVAAVCNVKHHAATSR
jgi:hypothetical protein